MPGRWEVLASLKLALRSLVCVGLALGAHSLAAQGKVWVVDDLAGPGVDFTAIQAAVDAAADGDTVLIRPGVYSASGPLAVIDGKGLTLIADAGAQVTMQGPGGIAVISIRNLAATQRCVLRGLAPRGNDSRALEIVDSAGAVWIEACTLICQGGIFSANTNDAVLYARNSASIALVRTLSTATHPLYPIVSSVGSGVLAFDSTLLLYDSTCRGGGLAHCCWQSGNYCCSGTLGGAGVRMQGGFLHASGSNLLGGQGLEGCALELSQCCGSGGPGGTGLHLLPGAAAPEAHLLDTATAGGPGGVGGHAPYAPTCPDGAPGIGIVAPPGSVESIAQQARSFELASPVRAGQSAHLDYAGVAGDLVIAAYELSFKGVWFPPFAGFLLPSYPPSVLVLGAAPSGTLALDLPFAPFPPGFDVLHVYAQAFAIGAGGEMVLGAPAQLTVLNQMF